MKIQIGAKPFPTLLLIFLLSFALRILGIGKSPPGLYNDELYYSISALAQLNHISSLMVPNFSISQWIFYFLNGYIGSLYFLGPTVLSSRMPEVIYGSLMIFPLYLVAKDLTKNHRIAVAAALLWSISPSAIITSRVGYGIEIFPLFIFLFIFLFLYRFSRDGEYKYLIIPALLVSLSVYYTSWFIWLGFPTLVSIISLLLIFILEKFGSRLVFVRHRLGLGFLIFMFTFFSIWTLVYLAWRMPSPIHNLLNSIIPYSSSLPSNNPFGFILFIKRLIYAISPTNIFIFPLSTNALAYGSPVQIPMSYTFLFPFLIIYLVSLFIQIKHPDKSLKSDYLILTLFFAGFLEPLFNLTNSHTNFEPSEGIFALPFLAIMISSGIFYLLNLIHQKFNPPIKVLQSISSPVGRNNIKKIPWDRYLTLLGALLVILSAFSVSSFEYSLNTSTMNYYQNNPDTLYYPFYGWENVSQYLVSNHLNKYPIYYVPGSGGWLNFSNENNLNYWYYHQEFPNYWLYYFSNGKVKLAGLVTNSVSSLIGNNGSILLSQEVNFTHILRDNGLRFRILDGIYRQNGQVAIQIIFLYPRG